MDTPLHDTATIVLAAAKRAGADGAEVTIASSHNVTLGCRLGQMEKNTANTHLTIGLRAYVGQQAAGVTSNNPTPQALEDLAQQAVALARATPKDPWAQLITPQEASTIELDIFDPTIPTTTELWEAAATTEAAALAETDITNSDGAEASWSVTEQCLATSTGIIAQRRVSGWHLSVTVVAGQADAMERDYAYTHSTHAAARRSPETVGREAAYYAKRRLNPRQAPAGVMPVLFEPRVARTLIRHFLSAINGRSVARGASFLDRAALGQLLFSPSISIADNPWRARSAASRLRDDEGTPTAPRALIHQGRLENLLLDGRSARQLGLTSTGHAYRSAGMPTSPSGHSIIVSPSATPPAELIAGIDRGLYIYELNGTGMRLSTGDYSCGCSGQMIEKGRLTHAVNESTLAGTMRAIWGGLIVANDVPTEGSLLCPTLLVDGLTVGGG